MGARLRAFLISILPKPPVGVFLFLCFFCGAVCGAFHAQSFLPCFGAQSVWLPISPALFLPPSARTALLLLCASCLRAGVLAIPLLTALRGYALGFCWPLLRQSAGVLGLRWLGFRLVMLPGLFLCAAVCWRQAFGLFSCPPGGVRGRNAVRVCLLLAALLLGCAEHAWLRSG